MSGGVVLFGVESVFTPEIVETLRRLAIPVVAGVVAGEPEWDMAGLLPIAPEEIAPEVRDHTIAVPWVTPGWRQRRVEEARRLGFRALATLIDPAGSVASTAELAAGTYVNAGATIGAHAVLGESALVNRNASVGHHTRLEAYVSLGPGATVAARCSIGKGTMVGAGATIAPGVTVGVNCVISVGAVVVRDLPANVLVAGNPARTVRSDIPGYRDIAVT